MKWYMRRAKHFDLYLSDHNYTIDLELENDAYRESSEELWEAIESTRWIGELDLSNC